MKIIRLGDKCEQVAEETVEELARVRVPSPTTFLPEFADFRAIPRDIPDKDTPLVSFNPFTLIILQFYCLYIIQKILIWPSSLRVVPLCYASCYQDLKHFLINFQLLLLTNYVIISSY